MKEGEAIGCTARYSEVTTTLHIDLSTEMVVTAIPHGRAHNLLISNNDAIREHVEYNTETC